MLRTNWRQASSDLKNPSFTAPRIQRVSRCSEAVRPANSSETCLSVGRTALHRQRSVERPSCPAPTAVTPIWRCDGCGSMSCGCVVAGAPRGVPAATDAPQGPTTGAQHLRDRRCAPVVGHQSTPEEIFVSSTTFPWESIWIQLGCRRSFSTCARIQVDTK